MINRVGWVLAGAGGLGLLILTINAVSAQRGAGFKPAVGPFTVAHATARSVLVLDTATGHVYQVDAADFKKASDLHGGALPLPRTDKDKPRFDKEEKREFKDEKKDPDKEGKRDFKDERKDSRKDEKKDEKGS